MYLPHLHFKCYSKSSPYPLSPHSSTKPTPTSWPWCSPVLRHIKFAKPVGHSFHWWLTRPSYEIPRQMDGPGGHHPEWGNPITKEHTWYALTDSLEYPNYELQSPWNSRRTKTKVWTLCPFLEFGTKHPWKELQRQSLELRRKDGPSRDCHTQGSIP